MQRFLTLFLLSGLFIATNTKAQVPTDTVMSTNISISPTHNKVSFKEPKKHESVYKIKPWLDLPLAFGGTAWTLYGFSVVYGRDSVPASELNALSRNKVNSFDRGTTDHYSTKAKSVSDMFFYGSMGLPIFMLLDKKIRKDAVVVGLIYLESMAITGTIYTISAMSANRFRPYAYNKDVPMSVRSRGGARNSFFAGHVAVVGTSTFFMASTIAHYHPEMKNKWILYSIAGGATLTTGYLRNRAGQHFPTDIIVGSLIGPAVGLLVPHFHHQRKNKDQRLSFVPHFDQFGSGVTAYYKL